MTDRARHEKVSRNAFRTRARTVDHLGREQIADCPTAVSELWKNAYDAYARSVRLDIYDESQPVAAISDDGHGMNRDEFILRWLVVGTETKTLTDDTPPEDRNGLELRHRQGQKGIGRLSCANLGSTCLIVSKRTSDPFVAALVDWRLFENPFVDLSDIHIPTTEFGDAEDLFTHLAELKSALIDNVRSHLEDDDRSARLEQAWDSFDQLREDDGANASTVASRFSSNELVEDILNAPFARRHIEQWLVANGDSAHGTSILISDLSYDLRVYLNDTDSDQAAIGSKKRFFETLFSFVDPFLPNGLVSNGPNESQFMSTVQVWKGRQHREIIGPSTQLHRGQIDGMEHRLDGSVDGNGVFYGKVKAFGALLPAQCRINPPKDLPIPRRAESELGPFQIYVATMEFDLKNTTHSPEHFQHYKDLARQFSGFMIFRDGLRVLPYGREDNDFFEIESRRSKHAGREFWNHRQMFGRLAISRQDNPNLKDKAGREGLLDNRAAKTLRVLVSNILMQAARNYFGTDSDIRKERLPQISSENKRKRAFEASERLRKRLRREFRTRLKKVSEELPGFVQGVQEFIDDAELESVEQIFSAQRRIERIRDQTADFELPEAPENLRSVEERKYANCRSMLQSVRSKMREFGDVVELRLKASVPSDPMKYLDRQLDEQEARIHRRIREWQHSVEQLQKNEHQRVASIVRERRQVFRTEASPFLRRFSAGRWSYVHASEQMSALFKDVDAKNRDLFVPYIAALESLQESIDLEHLATFGMEEISDLRAELERLNGLAQLGIAVEILGHELQSFDEMIGSGLRRLPQSVRESAAAGEIEFGYEGLTDQLRFLSPLRLSGPKIESWVTGSEIADYLADFFKLLLANNRISLRVTEEFKAFRVFDQRSRLFPVFINLLNNSIYWLGTSDQADRSVIIDVFDSNASEIVVSDNGPGVAGEDVESLFTLFFTRKIQGGRGVGLYLCRANLVAGGHSIRYEPSAPGRLMEGANFVISFQGAEFDVE